MYFYRTTPVILAICLLLALDIPMAHGQTPATPPKAGLEVQALLDQGDKAFKAGELDDALKLFTTAREQAHAALDPEGEATALERAGNCYRRRNQLNESQGFFEPAAALFRATGDKAGESRTLEVCAINDRQTGQFAKAIEIYQQVLILNRALGDKDGEAQNLLDIGLIYGNHDRQWTVVEREKSLEYYQQALDVSRAAGIGRVESYALIDIGNYYMEADQFAKAKEYYEQSLPGLRALGNKTAEGDALDGLAVIALIFHQWEKARPYYQQSLLLYRSTGDRRREAGALYGIGQAYLYAGRPQRALVYDRQALATYRLVGDRDHEAQILTTFGIIYQDIGQLQQALSCYLQALTIHRSLGNLFNQASTITDIGLLYKNIGQPQRALEHYHRAHELYHQVRNRDMEALVLNNVGNALSDMQQSQQALECYLQALAVSRSLGDWDHEADALNSIGNIHMATGHRQRALGYYRQAMAAYRLARDPDGAAAALENCGEVYMQIGQPERALACYRQALQVFRASENRPLEAEALEDLAENYISQNDFQQADALFRQAISLVEGVRSSLRGMTEAKIAFQQSNEGPYVHYLAFLVRMGRAADAFAPEQKMRARALLDMLSAGKNDLLSRLSDQDRARLGELRARANNLNTRMIAEGVKNEIGSKKRFATLQQDLRQTEEDLSKYTDTLLALHPEIARAGSVHTVNAAEAARMLPSDTALLEYAMLQAHEPGAAAGLDRILLFVVTPDCQVTIRKLKISPAHLTSLVSRFRADCADPRKSYGSEARALYRVLLNPAVKQLSGKKRLVICPDGPLWDVPFAALMDGNHFLADRFEIAYGYSATGVQASMAAREDRRRTRPQRLAMVVANPDFGGLERFGFGDEPRLPGQRPFPAPSRPFPAPARPFPAPARPIDVASQSVMATLVLPRGSRIRSLPGTLREAHAIQHDFPDTTAFLGKAAQEDTVKQEAARYRYLHFATHGFFNEAAPMLSSIVLAEPPPGSGNDGFLTAREIFDMHLSADMVVLSACNTARGEKRGGEGIIGMSWALFVAGVPTQVLSQWAVDDASTATLMEHFYAGIKRGEGKARALKEAEQALRSDGKHRHPYYWAPFVLMGDWRP